MSILITGGAGFIGSNLVDFFVSNGEQVIVVDDLSTGKLANLHSSIEKIIFYEQKIEEFDFAICSSVTSVIHLAAQVSVPLSISEFKRSSSSNIFGTICVIDFCCSKNIPLVYASSSALYGDLPFGNDSVPDVSLQSPYAADKHSMELYSSVAFKLHRLSSIGLRFFNVYGPRQDPSSPYSGVISVFIDHLMKKKSITINGGHQTRDFIYVEDVVKAIYRSYLVVNKEVLCEQINVLTGNSITIDALATLVIESFDWDVARSHLNLKPGDLEYSSGSVEKMVRILNIDLKGLIQLKDGLKSTINIINNTIN